MKLGNKILIIILVLLMIIGGAVLAYKFTKKNNQEEVALTNAEEAEEKQVQIFQGTDRPIAVMLDNHEDAWPQAGLNDAYLVYEIIVEGGESRLMALFKGVDLEKVGSVRSARHYFLDYALENDAIYVHYGWSPQAEEDIKTYNVAYINGISESETSFWRVKDKSAPHNVATSIEDILQIASSKNYRTTSNEESVLNYVADEFNLSDKLSRTSTSSNTATSSSTNNIGVANAKTVTIPYSYLHTVSYTYDEQTKLYTRYAREELQTDWDTEEAITTKNIIIQFIENYDLEDTENKGRQTLNNIGTCEGYYITNGEAIPITCTKTSRDSKTIYKDLNGNEIEINDGNTWINICPIDADVEILGE